MKVKVIIEETISQTFEVEVTDEHNVYKEIRQKYKSGELTVDNATLTQANVMILDENGEETDWNDLHV